MIGSRMTVSANLATEMDLKKTLLDAYAIEQPTDALSVGTVLGPFLIEALLGRGGMGQVYKVQQREPVVRPVALKLINQSKSMDTDAQSLRKADLLFEIERQALASLDHPNIAKLFDAGSLPTTPPRLYFAMEWVDGVTLDVFVRSIGGKPDAERQTIQALIDVCRGAHHAHQRRVVHRDLKPNNILVQQIDGRAVPKIIDFGIAIGDQVTSSQAAGTPEYMAPEQFQVARRLDARADVHALGVCLIELLCIARQSTALQQGWNSASLRSVLTSTGVLQRPDRGSEQLARAIQDIPQSLRAIARKAIEADPEQRYASAFELANELDAFLANRPVRAMPSSRRYLASLFFKRHRTAVLLSMLTIFALISGLGAAVYGLWQARHERQVAIEQADRAQQTSHFLAEVLTGVEPDQAKSMDTALLKQILRRAADDANQKLVNRPQMQAEILSIVARAYNAIGEYADAQKYAAAGVQRIESLPGLARERLELKLQLGQALSGQSQFRQAVDLASSACQQAERELGTNDLDSLRCLSNLAWDQYYVGDTKQSIETAERAGVALERINAPIAAQLYNLRVLGAALGEAGQLIQAEQVQRRLVAASTKHFGPEHTKTLSARSSLGVALLQQGRFAEAVSEYQSLLPLSEKVFGAEHQATISLLSNYAGALRQSGQVAASGPIYERALQLSSKRYGVDSGYTLNIAVNKANFEISNLQPQNAIDQLEAIDAKLLSEFGEQHPIYVEALRTRAKAHAALAQKSAAIKLWQRVLAWEQTADQSGDQKMINETKRAISELQ
jgi:eukaryotic-like serine/threonine-protein kinase